MKCWPLAALRTERSKALIVKTNDPFKYFYTELKEGGIYVVPQSSFLQAGIHNIQMPEAEFAGFAITGINGDGRFSYYNQNDDSPVDYKAIPVIPDFFTSYQASMFAQKGDVWNYYDYQGKALPTALRQIEGTVVAHIEGDNTVSW
jgi:hypothetical protein